jgi:hypothetical protein
MLAKLFKKNYLQVILIIGLFSFRWIPSNITYLAADLPDSTAVHAEIRNLHSLCTYVAVCTPNGFFQTNNSLPVE